MHDFQYYTPASAEEAVRLLGEHAGETRMLAGGTDLLIRMKRQEWLPGVLVNIQKVPGLRGLERRDGSLWIGPLTTMAEIVRSGTAAELVPVLVEAAATVGSVQVRNLATVGGNICNAAPSADTAPPLLALGAAVEILGPGGGRSLPIREFFTGAGENALAEDEMVTGFRVPLEEGWRAGYRKLEHREAMDISIAGVAVAVRPSESDASVWEDLRVALGAVAPTPFRATEVEELLRGEPLTDKKIAAAAEAAAAACRPIDDIRAPAWYRRHLVGVLAKRLLLELAGEVAP